MYAEGASPGTTWIGTGSTGTRFFVKRLKRGTQYTFGVRGRNSEGAGDASHPVTQNTPIASLHNALFFKGVCQLFRSMARVSVFMAILLNLCVPLRTTIIRPLRGKRIWLSISLSNGTDTRGCYFSEGTGSSKGIRLSLQVALDRGIAIG